MKRGLVGVVQYLQTTVAASWLLLTTFTVTNYITTVFSGSV